MPTTLEKFLDGRSTEDRSSGAPQVRLETEGAWFAGSYLGAKQHDYEGKPTTAYHFMLSESCAAKFGSEGEDLQVASGSPVRIYGKYLEGQLADSDIGKTAIIQFKGLAAKKKGKKPGKILHVQIVLT